MLDILIVQQQLVNSYTLNQMEEPKDIFSVYT